MAEEWTFKGPLGELKLKTPREVEVEIKDGQIFVKALKDTKKSHSLHGTFRSLINNCILGVSFKRI
jgi:large subunit ribosomal protein L6